MPKILEIKDLYIKVTAENRGSDFYAVKELNLGLEKGEVLGIVGESGSGKTLTALSVMGLLKQNIAVEKGDILYKGISLTKLPTKQRSDIYGKNISMIFQEPMNSLNPLMKIGRQVEENARIHTDLNKKEMKEQALWAMAQAGLKNPDEIYNSYPHQLSGGMRQRIMIASAIVCKPDILIADEPTTALDVTVQAQILELLKDLVDKNEMSMIFISHNIGVVSKICNRCAVMYKGSLLEYGETADIINNPSHPYTKGLIRSIPTPEKKGRPLYFIGGELKEEDLMDDALCPFIKRCSEKSEICLKSYPNLHEKIKGRKVRCLKAGAD